jgi:HSP20 family protein
MIFDQSWMTELLELQKKTAELAKGKNSADNIQSLVMEVLNRWGINNLPWEGDSKATMGVNGAPERESGANFDIDISETKNNVLIRASIPGIEDKTDLFIKLRGGILMITGKCNHLNQDDGFFSRKVRIPAEVTALGAEATYRNDNLTISLPKIAAEDGELIPVNFP